MRKISTTLLGLSFSIAALAPAAGADPLPKDLSQACQSDIQKFCSNVNEGKGRLGACLKAHDDQLSSDCQKKFQSARNDFKEKMKSAHAACSGDIQKFCNDSSDIKSCLDDHSSDLSQSCKSFRENLKTG